MAALMPRWISVGLLTAFLHAGIYDNIRSAFSGSDMIKGLKFGLVIALVYAGIKCRMVRHIQSARYRLVLVGC